MPLPRHSLLDREQEYDLIRKAQAGDGATPALRDRALTKLVRHNQALITKIIRPFQLCQRHLRFEDLMQEGNYGLTVAISRFDISTGNKLSTYAYWSIYQAVTRAIARQEDIIRQPVYVLERQKQIRKTVHILYQQAGKSPTLEAIAAQMEQTVDWVMNVIDTQSMRQLRSLDVPILRSDRKADEGGSDLSEYVVSPLESPEEFTDRCFERDRLDAAIAQLPSQWGQVIRLRFGLDGEDALTYTEIANRIGLGEARASQLESKALHCLKQLLSDPH